MPPKRSRARSLANLRPAPPAPKGNTRAVKSGARSRKALSLAPIRQKHLAELHRDYPKLDDRRLVLLADRLARIEAVMSWLDANGIVRDRKGEPHPLLPLLERWSIRAEQLLREAEESNRAASIDLATALSGEAEDAA